MRVYRRRRVYTLVVFLALAGVVFLAFQMLSIKVLNFESQQRQEREPKTKCENGFDCKKNQRKDRHYIETEINHHDKLIKHSRRNDDMAPIKNKGDVSIDGAGNKEKEDVVKFHPKQLKPRTAKPINLEEKLSEETEEEERRPRGVPRHWARLYKPNADSMFTCTDSREKIPFDHVNDDYCDCKDGSDEPGTSACINGRFYCRVQLFSHDLKHVPSSQVNDGICDCCDGSDEWENNLLPDHVKLTDDRPGYGLYQAPCKNRCEMLLKQAEKVNHIRQEAMPIKARYIQGAKGKSNPNLLYGKDGEYYVLSEECYKHRADKYKYTVCPFKEVRQEAAMGSPKVIGRSPAEWVVHQNYGNQLKMARGDSVQCPGHQSRISWVTFTCGLKDEVMSVQETEICEYTVVFSTPVAC